MLTLKNMRQTSPRKRVLIVNCYFDDSRQPLRRTTKIPQSVGPIYLAGAFERDLCDVRCYNEQASGPLEDEHLLGWPDMLVLTGLTNSFDRMLHLTAYVRSKNSSAIVVAGGPAIRMLPILAKKFFDYACMGDVEEMAEVIHQAFGPEYLAEQTLPRYDLAYWLGHIGYVESTRYCNFHCSFCTLTGEGRPYQKYNLEYIRQQILASGKRKRMFFIDNNFYGNDRDHFRARIDLINEMRGAGQFENWGALVTNDFYHKDENLRVAYESGCRLLFSGVESFDTEWLREFSKLHNTTAPQVDLISKCLNAGIIFYYGLIVDFSSRSVAEIRRELDFIVDTPEITLPCYASATIPMLGTPFFFDCLAQQKILPSTKLRDMDGTTLTLKPKDPIPEVVRFLDDLQCFRGFRKRILKHSVAFTMKYRNKLSALHLSIAAGAGLLLSAQTLSTSVSGFGWAKRRIPRTYVSTTEPLDHMYTPAFRVDSRFESYFKPTMVTDKSGQLHEHLVDSGVLKANAYKARSAAAS